VNAVQIQFNPFAGKPAGLAMPGPGVLHVWEAQLDSVFEKVPDRLAVLSPEERTRALRFKVQKGHDEFVGARIVLRTLLGAYLKIEPGEVRLDQEANGKPCLEASHPSGLRFNLSHSEGLMVAAFGCDCRIGIDVEKIREDFDIEEIWERFFSPAERQSLRTIPLAEKYAAFFRCWTRKEAYIKARGEGLSHPLHQFDVSTAREEAALLATRPDAAEAGRWLLHTLPVREGYVAAVAVEKNPAPAPVRRPFQPEHRALPS
jgi:4'-phosphopantetheinyl transferase